MKSRPLELDFIAPPRRSRWAGYLLLAVSLAAAADLVNRYQEIRLALNRAEAAHALVAPPRPAVPAAGKEQLDEQLRNVQAVMRQLSIPWAGLIASLESAASDDVAMLQLQPDMQQRMLRVTAEARNPDAMLEYARRLAATRGFTDVHLSSHQAQLTDPQRPIQFAVQASFREMP